MISRKPLPNPWRFTLDDTPQYGDPHLDDSAWRNVRIPHDWSVEHAFDPAQGEGCTGYLPGGIGYYRQHFDVEDLADKPRVYICFDGVYNHAQVMINGVVLGDHPYGYSPFYYDISPYVQERDNVLAVRVDHSRIADSRWYSGSGIYRPVYLIQHPPVHFDIWPTYITTPTPHEVWVETLVRNGGEQEQTCRLRTTVMDADDNIAAKAEDTQIIPPGETITLRTSLTIDPPRLWQLHDPAMYRAVQHLVVDGQVDAHHETPFGIRQFAFDPDKGFSLNGEHMKLKGVCLHHDAGLVGAAVPDDVWRRRLHALKAAGCNAIRTSHNPPSEAFLDLCDTMGFIVKHEFFDEWDYPKDKRLNGHEQHDDARSRGYAADFHTWAQHDLHNAMRRDRNHPAIVLWSIGNEIELCYMRLMQLAETVQQDAAFDTITGIPTWTPASVRAMYEKIPAQDYDMDQTAQQLAQWTRALDGSRPVSANYILPSASFETGACAPLDVVGFSYRQQIYDYAHQHYPRVPIFGGENFGQWHEWQAVMERDFVAGMFIWTGIDYMGESHDSWPKKGSGSGLLDLAGFPKPLYYMFQSLWTDAPMIHLYTQTLADSEYRVDEQGELVEKVADQWRRRQWGWYPLNEHYQYPPNTPVIAEVYSNCEEAELLLNGQSLGRQALADHPDHIYKWTWAYLPGTLTVRGYQDSRMVTTDTLQTPGPLTTLAIQSDRSTMLANAADVAHITVQLTDHQGCPIRHQEEMVTFQVSGPCRVLGVDNGWVSSVQDYQSDHLLTHHGRALLIVQATDRPGMIHVRVRCGEDLHSDVHVMVKT